MNRSTQEIQNILSTFGKPDRSHYPELEGYSDDECYQDFFGGGGLYLATHMLRTLHIKPNELVRYEHEKDIDPFDVQICLDQIEWGKTHQPRKSLFVLTARKI
jgi:hypothetical protein